MKIFTMSRNEENIQVLAMESGNLTFSNTIGTECQASEESDDDFCALDLLLSNIWSMLGQELNYVGDVKRKVKFNSFNGRENNPSILPELTFNLYSSSSRCNDNKKELREDIPLEKIRIANKAIEEKSNHASSDSSQEKSTEPENLVDETRLTERLDKATNSSPKPTIEERESFYNSNISEKFNISNSAPRQNEQFQQKPTKSECNKDFPLPCAFLAEKPRAFTYREVFICGECQKKFMFESAFISHMKKHDKPNHFTSKKVYKCKNCQRKFTFGWALISHMQKHNKPNLNLHEIRKESTLHGVNLKTSILPEPNPVTSENALKHRTRQKRFIKELTYISLRDYDEPNPYKCEKCPKEFSFKSQLRRHNTVHMEAKPFKCDLCDYSSKWKHALTRHVKGCHES